MPTQTQTAAPQSIAERLAAVRAERRAELANKDRLTEKLADTLLAGDSVDEIVALQAAVSQRLEHLALLERRLEADLPREEKAQLLERRETALAFDRETKVLVDAAIAEALEIEKRHAAAVKRVDTLKRERGNLRPDAPTLLNQKIHAHAEAHPGLWTFNGGRWE